MEFLIALLYHKNALSIRNMSLLFYFVHHTYDLQKLHNLIQISVAEIDRTYSYKHVTQCAKRKITVSLIVISYDILNCLSRCSK